MQKACVALFAGMAVLLASPGVVNAQPYDWNFSSNNPTLSITDGTGTNLTGGQGGGAIDTANRFQDGDNVDNDTYNTTLTITGDNSAAGSGSATGNEVTTIGNLTATRSPPYPTTSSTRLTFNLDTAASLTVGDIGTSDVRFLLITVTNSGTGLTVGRTYSAEVSIAANQKLSVGGGYFENLRIESGSTLHVDENLNIGRFGQLNTTTGVITGGAGTIAIADGKALTLSAQSGGEWDDGAGTWGTSGITTTFNLNGSGILNVQANTYLDGVDSIQGTGTVNIGNRGVLSGTGVEEIQLVFVEAGETDATFMLNTNNAALVLNKAGTIGKLGGRGGYVVSATFDLDDSLTIKDTVSEGFGGNIGSIGNIVLENGLFTGGDILTIGNLIIGLESSDPDILGSGDVTLRDSLVEIFEASDPSFGFFGGAVSITDGATLRVERASFDRFESLDSSAVSVGGVNFYLGTEKGGATLIVGNISGSADQSTGLVLNDWTSHAGSTVRFGIDQEGIWSSLTIEGNIDASRGAAQITLNDSGNLGILGKNMAVPPDMTIVPGASPFVWLVAQDAEKTGKEEDFAVEDFRTSRFNFMGHYFEAGEYFYGHRAWGYHVEQAPAIPDLSSQIIVNIIGFELPRAQYTDGPWVRFKGGTLNDNKATFDKHTYQFVQAGWDKTFDVRNGAWNAGLFMEGNWLYGSGDHNPWGNEVMGKLSSTHTGMGAGLYLGREFRNRTYFDIVGRVTQFGNSAKNRVVANGNPDENYTAEWSNQIFTMGLEVGRTFSSRDDRYSLNVYNRLLYNSTSANEFSVNYEDGSYLTAHVNGFGGWTNRLGGRLTFHQLFGKPRRSGYYGQAPCESLCDPCDPCGSGNGGGRASNIQFFVGADYYQGLNGRFGGSFSDPNMGIVNQPLTPAHAKNNMSYGTASVGMTLIPRDNLSFGLIGESLFGDVSGYGLTFMTKVTF